MTALSVADPGVVHLVRLNPPDPKPTLSNNTFQCKKSSVQVILDVRLHYLGVLALFITADLQVLLSFFLAAARFSGKCNRKGGVVDENFSYAQ